MLQVCARISSTATAATVGPASSATPAIRHKSNTSIHYTYSTVHCVYVQTQYYPSFYVFLAGKSQWSFRSAPISYSYVIWKLKLKMSLTFRAALGSLVVLLGIIGGKCPPLQFQIFVKVPWSETAYLIDVCINFYCKWSLNRKKRKYTRLQVTDG